MIGFPFELFSFIIFCLGGVELLSFIGLGFIFSLDVDILNLYFKILYCLAKQSSYKYNIEKAIEISKKIKTINPDLFKYTAEREELEGILGNNE